MNTLARKVSGGGEAAHSNWYLCAVRRILRCYYLRAQKVRTLIKRDFDLAWQNGVDVILTPTTPVLPFAPGEITDPVAMYLNDIFTVTVNMAGLPSMSVPSALNKDGLPLGLQLIGRPFDECTLFQVGHVIEENAGHFKPTIWW